MHTIIAVSESTKRDLVDLLGISEKKITVVYSGIDSAFRVLAADDPRRHEVQKKYGLPKRFMLYLGNLEPRKNIEGIIEAYTYFRARAERASGGVSAPAPQLLIAGAPSWRYHSIAQTAANSPYARDIRFLGYVDSGDKPALYNLAELFIFPSFYEGFGFPPLEAAACGTPSIISTAASLPEVSGPGSIAVNPHDIADIAHAMQEVTRHASLRNLLRERGLAWSRRYTWQRTAEETLDILTR